jgi:hypothetical protein
MNAIRTLFLALTAALLGCAPAAPKIAKVTGTVKFDGAPLAKGDIVFASATGGAPAMAAVANGKFELEAAVGKYRVEVRAMRASKTAPKNTGGPGSENASRDENYIPDRYNDNTTLSAEVLATGSNSIDFDLKK